MGVLMTIGLACGATVAVVAGRGANALLFGLTPRDPATFLGAIGVLAVIALVACSIPAFNVTSKRDRRASLRMMSLRLDDRSN